LDEVVLEHIGSSWLAGPGAAYRTQVPLSPGLHGSAKLLVTEADTALALRSGEVEVLGTPRVIALAEEAAMAAVADRLPAGQTTVGMRVQIDHLAPTSIGSSVAAEATLEKVEGRRLTFTISVSDHCGLVAAGKVTRVIVETERFLEKAR
jgi:fluoroacetyl-CoA thioesterase